MEEYQNKDRKEYEDMVKELNSELLEKLDMLETDEEKDKLNEEARQKRREIIRKIGELDKKPRLKSVYALGQEFLIEERKGI